VKLLKKVGGIHDRVEAKLNLDPREEDLNGIPYVWIAPMCVRGLQCYMYIHVR
jgi:hypothetical protein